MNLRFGICTQTMVPLREIPSHKSQMVNELLFGDLFLVKDKMDDWLFIETIDDNYEAWIDEKQVEFIDEKEFETYKNANRAYSLNDCLTSTSADENISIKYTLGSLLPLFENNSFKIGNNKFLHNNKVQEPNKANLITNRGEETINLAKKYLNAPYLWGGRSVFGIDCSGFTQIIFKMSGIFLPRDASQQIEKGEVLSFIEESQAGDLAFFENEEGKINHVGILINNHTIIHSSGKVKIDKIDHNGIYDQEHKKYTHKLRLIKHLDFNS